MARTELNSAGARKDIAAEVMVDLTEEATPVSKVVAPTIIRMNTKVVVELRKPEEQRKVVADALKLVTDRNMEERIPLKMVATEITTTTAKLTGGSNFIIVPHKVSVT